MARRGSNRDFANRLYAQMIADGLDRGWFISTLVRKWYITEQNAATYFYHAKKAYDAGSTSRDSDRRRYEEKQKAEEALRQKAKEDFEAFERNKRTYEEFRNRKFEEALFKAFKVQVGIPANICAILGIVNTATKAEVNAAWKKLAFQFHPDRGGSLVKMQEINAARDTALKYVKE